MAEQQQRSLDHNQLNIIRGQLTKAFDSFPSRTPSRSLARAIDLVDLVRGIRPTLTFEDEAGRSIVLGAETVEARNPRDPLQQSHDAQSRAKLMKDQMGSHREIFLRRADYISSLESPAEDKITQITAYKGNVENIRNIEKVLGYILGEDTEDFLFTFPSGDGFVLGDSFHYQNEREDGEKGLPGVPFS